MDAPGEIERLEDENTRLRSAAEQALMAVGTMLEHVPATDRLELQATVASINELMEPPERD